MEPTTTLIGACLGISFLTLSAVLTAAHREHRKARAQLEAAWVVLEAAHPDIITNPNNPPQT